MIFDYIAFPAGKKMDVLQSEKIQDKNSIIYSEDKISRKIEARSRYKGVTISNIKIFDSTFVDKILLLSPFYGLISSKELISCYRYSIGDEKRTFKGDRLRLLLSAQIKKDRSYLILTTDEWVPFLSSYKNLTCLTFWENNKKLPGHRVKLFKADLINFLADYEYIKEDDIKKYCDNNNIGCRFVSH